VRAHQAGSHARKGWEEFTQKVIDTVAKVRTDGVVFLAWGSPAQKRCAKISGARHLVLKSVHPSPLSAYQGEGFFNNAHFKKTNEWLEQRYGKEGVVNWDLNVPKPVKAVEGKPEGKVKATEGQKEGKNLVDGVPGVERKEDVKKVDPVEEFEGMDDEDALEALEEVQKLEQEAQSKSNNDLTEKKEEAM
jgi:uracil-DNA glycosylase